MVAEVNEKLSKIHRVYVTRFIPDVDGLNYVLAFDRGIFFG